MEAVTLTKKEIRNLWYNGLIPNNLYVWLIMMQGGFAEKIALDIPLFASKNSIGPEEMGEGTKGKVLRQSTVRVALEKLKELDLVDTVESVVVKIND